MPLRQIAIGMRNDVRCGGLIKIIWRDGIGMSLYSNGWSAADSCGRRRPMAHWQFLRPSSPTCSTASTGETRGIPGGQPAPDKGSILQESAGRVRDSLRVMDADLAALPDDIAALKAALAAERVRVREVLAERDAGAAALAVARAKASEDLALIAHQKLRIAHLERQV
jgi:hypothetical protein